MNFYLHLVATQILEQPEFKCVEKIKTISTTYMAASGLAICDDVTKDMNHVVAVAEFAFALKRQLKEVNEHSWNNFKLRIGTKYSELCASSLYF